MTRRLAALLRSQSVLAVAMALVAAWIVIEGTGGNAYEALKQMGAGAIGDLPGAFSAAVRTGEISIPPELLRTFAKATPLLMSGLAVAVALRAGLFNIGAEGQLLVGGFAAAWIGFAWHDAPMWVHLPAAALAGGFAGACWAGVAGFLKAWRGAHEVIVTIMLNYLAILLTHWLVNGIARDTTSLAPATPQILASARLWSPSGASNFSAGFVIALMAVPAVSLLLYRTALGYEIRAIGLNEEAARCAGISVPRTILISMACSGFLAGLAGAIEVLGVHGRFLDAFSPGYGFDGIAVALLGNLQPVGILASACLFGGLAGGAVHMEAFTGTPRQVAGILQAVVIVAVGIKVVRAHMRRTIE